MKEISYQFIPDYHKFMRERLKPSPFEPPKTFSEKQRYGPIKQSRFIDGAHIMEVALIKALENPKSLKKPPVPKLKAKEENEESKEPILFEDAFLKL